MEHHYPIELQNNIEKAILQHTLSKGQTLTLGNLSQRFRTTPELMSQVLQAEVRKGLIARKGNNFQIIGLSEKRLDSLFQHTSRAGMKPTSIVRAVFVEPSGQEVAARLDIPAGSPVYHQERTRIINSEVLAIQVNYIPYEICPGLENDDLSRYSFQKLLEERYHTVISEIQEEYAILPGSESDLEILGLPRGSQVLVIDRLSLSHNHAPLVWASIHIRIDRYKYVSTLWPNAARLLEEHNLYG